MTISNYVLIVTTSIDMTKDLTRLEDDCPVFLSFFVCESSH